MRPHIRDSVFCGATTEGVTATIDLKAGDLVIGFHTNYSTTTRMSSTVNLGLAIGGTWASKWQVSGTAQTTSVWAVEVSEDFTATLGPGVTYTAGTYGVTQCVLALRGVKHIANYYLDAANPDLKGPLTVAQSGRPFSWVDATTPSPITATNFSLGEDVGVLTIGGWTWDAATKFGQGGDWIPTTGETILSWDDTASWRHTCVSVAWHEPSDILEAIGSGELTGNYCFYASKDGNETGAPGGAMGVSFAVIPEEYPADGDLWFGDRATSATPGDVLTVDASAGDWCLFATACQYGSQADHTPSGWTGVHGDTGGGRSGTVAVHRVEADGPVSVTVPSTTGGRIAASLAVLRGVEELTPSAWVDGPPTLPNGPCLVLVNANAVSTAQNATFSPISDVIVDHEETRSASESWTGCGVYYVEVGGGLVPTIEPATSTSFSAWAVIPLGGGAPEPPTPSFTALTMGDGTPVTLVGYWDGERLLEAEFVGLATA